MCEVASDWNYANTGIYGESAFIFGARRSRRFPGAQLPVLRCCRMLTSIADQKFVRRSAGEHEESA
jgi:hypothetical protein